MRRKSQPRKSLLVKDLAPGLRFQAAGKVYTLKRLGVGSAIVDIEPHDTPSGRIAKTYDAPISLNTEVEELLG